MMDKSVYRRPDKPRTVLRHRERTRDFKLTSELVVPEVLAVDRATECHVTPPAVASEMARLIATAPKGLKLEPEAGTGNLVKAMVDIGIDASCIYAIERHVALWESLAKRFEGQLTPMNRCFLEWASSTQERFTAIIMNPPFRQVKAHVKAALSLLSEGEGAMIVALVPITFEMAGFVDIRPLPVDTFPNAKVRTKLVHYIR